MHFYPGITDQAIWGNNPIPTPRLDELYGQIPKIEATEMMDLSAAVQCGYTEIQRHCNKILDDRTLLEKREEWADSYESAGNEMVRFQKRIKKNARH
jgi:hypothetical protein